MFSLEDIPQEKVLRALKFQCSYLFSAEKYCLVNAEKNRAGLSHFKSAFFPAVHLKN